MNKRSVFVSVLFPASFLAVLWGQMAFLGMEDDAFFYCRIAANFVSECYLSFDGLTATNGFHPLWMILLVPLRLVAGGGTGFMVAAVTLSAVLMGVCGYLFLARSSRYSLPVVLLTYLFLLRYIRDFSLMCMETSVLLPLAFLLLLRSDSVNVDSRRNLWANGVLAALIFLSRLDSVLLLVPLVIILLIKTGRKGAAPLLIPGIAAGAAYLTVNLGSMGTPFSVSGMMKASGFGWNSLFAGQLFAMSDPLGIRSPWGLYLFLLVLAFFVVFMKEKPRSAYASAICLIGFTFVQLFMSQWRLWYWYAYPAVLFLAFGVPPLLQMVYRKMKVSSRAERTVSALLLSAVVVLSVYWGINYGRTPEDDFRYRNMLIAMELNELLPDSAIVAVGDRAGSFAYFFHGHVIQAEGLAGDVQLVRAIQSGNLEEYLHDAGCGYILSWTGPHMVEDYDRWELRIPDPAQCRVYGNTIEVFEEDEIRRWPGEDLSVFLWRLNEH
jgi:hypothetical protein